MDVYQRKDAAGRLLSPYWYYDASIPNPNDPGMPPTRVRRSTGERTKALAKRVAVDQINKAHQDAQEGSKSMTALGAMDQYVAELEAAGKPSARDAKGVRAKLFGQGPWAARGTHKLSPDLILERLSQTHIGDLRRARLNEGLAPASVALELRLLRAAVLLATSDPTVRAPRIKWSIAPVAGKTRWLSPEEWQKVYEVMDPQRPIATRGGGTAPPPQAIVDQRVQARDLLVALTMCGGRWSEVARLTTDQIMVRDGVTRVRLFGYKVKKERIVPVPPQFEEVLRRRLAIAQANRTPFLFQSNSRAVIKSKRGGQDAPQTTSRSLRRAFDLAGCNAPHLVERDGTATAHSLRHTFASMLRQRGVDLAGVKDLLGHADISTTLRYAHLGGDDNVDLAARIIGVALNAAPFDPSPKIPEAT